MKEKELKVYLIRLLTIVGILFIIFCITNFYIIFNINSIKKDIKMYNQVLPIKCGLNNYNPKVEEIETEKVKNSFKPYWNYGEMDTTVKGYNEQSYSFHDGSIIYVLPKNDNYKGFKSYMPYTAITNSGSYQYDLQENFCISNDYGFRIADGRYCVAVGSFGNMKIGQYFDIIMENGKIIPCVMGDLKANTTTDSHNVYSINSNYCCTEFIVDYSCLNSDIKKAGDASAAHEEWNSKVIAFRIYNDNIFDIY